MYGERLFYPNKDCLVCPDFGFYNTVTLSQRYVGSGSPLFGSFATRAIGSSASIALFYGIIIRLILNNFMTIALTLSELKGIFNDFNENGIRRFLVSWVEGKWEIWMYLISTHVQECKLVLANRHIGDVIFIFGFRYWFRGTKKLLYLCTRIQSKRFCSISLQVCVIN